MFVKTPETCTLEEQGITNIILGLEEYENFDFSEFKYVSHMGGFNYDVENDNFVMEMGGDGPGTSPTNTITSLDLSDAVYLETINPATVYMSESFNKLILPQNGMLKTIGESAFAYNAITELHIPASVEIISYHAFEENGITSLIFEDTEENPSHLTTIEEEAFRVNDITSVILPGSLTTIGNYPFRNNENLNKIVLKRDNTEGMTLGDAWNCSDSGYTCVNVIYDPNYTE